MPAIVAKRLPSVLDRTFTERYAAQTPLCGRERGQHRDNEWVRWHEWATAAYGRSPQMTQWAGSLYEQTIQRNKNASYPSKLVMIGKAREWVGIAGIPAATTAPLLPSARRLFQ